MQSGLRDYAKVFHQEKGDTNSKPTMVLEKFFKSRAEQVMKPINVEILMSHSTGVSDSYYRPIEKDLLEDYLKAIDLLTINDDKIVRQKKVEELTEKSKDNEYAIRGKLDEKDKQIEALIKKQEQFENLIQSLIDSGQLKSAS